MRIPALFELEAPLNHKFVMVKVMSLAIVKASPFAFASIVAYEFVPFRLILETVISVLSGIVCKSVADDAVSVPSTLISVFKAQHAFAAAAIVLNAFEVDAPVLLSLPEAET